MRMIEGGLADPPDEGAQLPPHSLEAEQSVLGGLLLDNSAWPKIEALEPEHLFSDAHREIFTAMRSLFTGGAPVDVVTLAEALKTRGRLDYIGGMPYLAALVEGVPTAANIERCRDIVLRHSTKRRLAGVAQDIARAAYAPAGDAAILLDDAAEKIDQLRTHTKASLSQPEPLNLAALAREPVPEREYRVGRIMATGTVGEWTGHGGAGKTQCAIHLGVCLATQLQFFGEPTRLSRVGFVSGEDDARELHRRLAQQAGKLDVALAELADRLFVYDLTEADPTLLVVTDKRVTPTSRYNWLKREIERRCIDVVILDNRATLFDGDVNVPGTATRAIALFGELAPAGGNVIILAHVDKATARAGYAREAYSGTAAWHNRARWRWYLHQPNAEEDALPGEGTAAVDDSRRILEVQKNNAGPTGARFPLRLTDGAIVADGIGGGMVASIERANERKSVLAAMQEAASRCIDVPAAESGSSTSYQALEVLPSFPASLHGKNGRTRLFRLLRQMRADGDIKTCRFSGGGRHRRDGYCLPGAES